MHPCKSYWAETNINTPTKTKSKKGHTLPKFGRWLPISNLTCILQWYKVLQSFNEINASLQKFLSGNEQQKLSWKRAITQPKFGGISPISNLTCILQWYKVLPFEWNQCIPSKLLSGNEVWQRHRHRRRRQRCGQTWSLCFCHAMQATQKG